jgi:hypothetical protein
MADPIGWPAIIGMVGGLVGMAGGLASFYDRFYKGRPVASLTTQEKNGVKFVLVRITNTTSYDVIIDGAGEKRGVYFLAEDASTHNIVKGQLNRKMFSPFVLKPSDSKELFVMAKYKDNVAIEALGNRYVEFMIYWRRGNSTWLRQIPIPVCTNTRTIRQLGGVEE